MSLEKFPTDNENTPGETLPENNTTYPKMEHSVWGNDLAIESSIRNDLNNEEFKELSAHELVEDLGTYDVSDQSINKMIALSIAEGYRVEQLNYYDENNTIVAQKHYRIKKDLNLENTQLVESIFDKFEELRSGITKKVQEQKEAAFQEKVRNGEMKYLGEVSLDEYGEMISNGLPLENIQLILSFDTDGNPDPYKQKVFVYNK